MLVKVQLHSDLVKNAGLSLLLNSQESTLKNSKHHTINFKKNSGVITSMIQKTKNGEKKTPMKTVKQLKEHLPHLLWTQFAN